MRVALFFDGKNFYAGLKDQAPDQVIDFAKMSQWIVEHVNGTHLWGAYYYTGVEAGPGAMSEGQKKLSGFLDMLEFQPGFFVKRFPRKVHNFSCSSCGADNRFSLEKEIDTTMVADMLTLAAVNAFDILVLLSGDADHTPAVEGVRQIGKKVYVATWGTAGLSARIRRAAFHHIDLMDGLDSFSVPSSDYNRMHHHAHNHIGGDGDYESSDYEEYYEADDEPPLDDAAIEEYRPIFMTELSRAQMTFHSGYVGMNYFLKRWQSDQLQISTEERRRVMDVLAEEGFVEIYHAEDGNKALRMTEAGREEFDLLDDGEV